MIRFQPDSLREALLRPLAMAAPDSWAYVEFGAPDLRFAIALLLLPFVAWVWGRMGPQRRSQWMPTLGVLLITALAFVPWLATTGNGRYFMPFLLLVGPLCVGMIKWLPGSLALRGTLASGVLALQAIGLALTPPWGVWTLAKWERAPAFHVDVPEAHRLKAGTYVSLSVVSYSLIIREFHPDSRWIGAFNLPPLLGEHPDARRARQIVAAAAPDSLFLIVPALTQHPASRERPNEASRHALAALLLPHGLRLRADDACVLLRSRGLQSVEDSNPPQFHEGQPLSRDGAGFWLCGLQFDPTIAAPASPGAGRHDAAFAAVEQACPRFFPPGQGYSIRTKDGEFREYAHGEMRVYVSDDGQLFYRYARAINAVHLGPASEVIAGRRKPDCNRIHGRSGLPWGREP